MLSKKARFMLDSLIEDLRHYKNSDLRYLPAWDTFCNFNNKSLFTDIHSELHDEWYFLQNSYRDDFSDRLKEFYKKYLGITRAKKEDVIDYLEFRGMSVKFTDGDGLDYRAYIQKADLF